MHIRIFAKEKNSRITWISYSKHYNIFIQYFFFSWHDYRKYTIAPITIKPKKKKEKIGTEIFRLCWEWKAELDFEAGGNISMWSFFSWVLKSIGNNRKILILLAYSSSISLICSSVPVSGPRWRGDSFFVLEHLSGRIFTL